MPGFGNIPSVLVRRLARGNDGQLVERTSELLGVDTAEDDGTALIANGAKIHAESTALDEVLLSQLVEDQGVGALPTGEVGAGTQDTRRQLRAGGANTEDLLVDPRV